MKRRTRSPLIYDIWGMLLHHMLDHREPVLSHHLRIPESHWPRRFSPALAMAPDGHSVVDVTLLVFAGSVSPGWSEVCEPLQGAFRQIAYFLEEDATVVVVVDDFFAWVDEMDQVEL